MLACRRGEESAWVEPVTRHQRLVFSVPRRAGLGEDAAADAFQHVFATLVEHLDGIERPSRIRAWLVTTARRDPWRLGQRDAANRSSAVAGEEGEHPMAGLPDPGLQPDEEVLPLEQHHHLGSAVGAVDERLRTLPTLLFHEPDPPPYTVIECTSGTSEGSIGPTRARRPKEPRRVLPDLGDADAGRRGV